MRPADLRNMHPDDLDKHISEARRELFGLRMQHATGELENTARLQTARRELARALTIARNQNIDSNETTTARTDG
jgi:large subunit ribosomal protein L29